MHYVFYYVFCNKTGIELFTSLSLEEAMAFADSHKDCNVQDDGSDEIIYEA